MQRQLTKNLSPTGIDQVLSKFLVSQELAKALEILYGMHMEFGESHNNS
jgi:hypothetical protein